ncbi:hypothetical protein IJG79_02785 [Candidatus Saccharibacteria bacterium]|nr:hypothetical protein [Candidatus Saccharibacteria bacterium]
MDLIIPLLADIKDTLEKLPNQGGVGADLMTNILYWLFGIGGLVAVAIIVYGGYKYQRSEGDPAKSKQASQILAYAVIGLVVVVLATAITAFVSNMIGEAAK